MKNLRRSLSTGLHLILVGITTLLPRSLPAIAQSTSAAAPVTHTLALHLDPEKTKIQWTVGGLLTKLHGNFKLNGGEVIADPKTGVAQGEVEIDAASGAIQAGKSTSQNSTPDAARTAKWQKDVLNSGKYPAIIFHPTSVQDLKDGDGDQTVIAKGTVTLAGTDHPVELTIKLNVKGKDVTGETHFVVPYVKWGLKNPSSGFTRYDREVRVDINAVGTLQEGTARASSTPAATSK